MQSDQLSKLYNRLAKVCVLRITDPRSGLGKAIDHVRLNPRQEMTLGTANSNDTN